MQSPVLKGQQGLATSHEEGLTEPMARAVLGDHGELSQSIEGPQVCLELSTVVAVAEFVQAQTCAA